VKFLKILILLAIPFGLWQFVENYPAGYYLDQTALPYKLYISFFSDFALPFGLYFGLCLFEKWIPRLKPWQVKVFLAFLPPAVIEIAQFLYQKLNLTQIFAMYGGAFDPLDFVAFAVGGLLAAFLERQVFSRYFEFWEGATHKTGLKLDKA
jgi:hypothetical protein